MLKVDPALFAIVAQLAAVNAILTPVIVATVTKSHWENKYKAVVAFCCCLLSALIAVVLGGDIVSVAVALPAAMIAMQKAYTMYWKDSGLAPWISQLTDGRHEDTEA